jgi:uncharacterized SAM-binding protein YcdF (DUF218 family)
MQATTRARSLRRHGTSTDDARRRASAATIHCSTDSPSDCQCACQAGRAHAKQPMWCSSNVLRRGGAIAVMPPNPLPTPSAATTAQVLRDLFLALGVSEQQVLPLEVESLNCGGNARCSKELTERLGLRPHKVLMIQVSAVQSAEQAHRPRVAF